MRKIYIVPNLVTTANIFCGFYSIILAFHQDWLGAARFLIFAQICDALDGRIARMAKATSSFGVEYDSLSDLVSFGLAPAMLIYLWSLEPLGRVGWIVAFLYLVCAALRLARFNVTTHVKTSSKYFQGAPSPVAAGLLITFVIFHQETGWPGGAQEFETQLLAGGMALLMAGLMVSTIPFPSFKEVNWRSRASFGIWMSGLLAMALIGMNPETNLFGVVCAYVFGTLIWNLIRKLRWRSNSGSMVGEAGPK